MYNKKSGPERVVAVCCRLGTCLFGVQGGKWILYKRQFYWGETVTDDLLPSPEIPQCDETNIIKKNF